MDSEHLDEAINLAFPEPVIELADEIDVIEQVTAQLGTPRVTELESGLTEYRYDAVDEHDLRLLLDGAKTVVGFGVEKQKQPAPVTCPKAWLRNYVQAVSTSAPVFYTGFPLGFSSALAYDRSRNLAEAALAANVAVILPTLCPGTCPPGCTCIPKAWTQTAIVSRHLVVRRILGIPVRGRWISTASRWLDAYCK